MSTLCDPMGGPGGFSVHGIFKAKILEWFAMPSPVDLPDPGIEPALTRGFFTTNATWEAHKYVCVHIYIYTHIKICGRDFIWLVKSKIFIIWTFT